MKKIKSEKCNHCGRLYQPDHRNVGRQKYCGESNCQAVSKKLSQDSWLSKPGNKAYCDSSAKQRVQEWRAKHPGYSQRGKKRAKKGAALQDSFDQQPVNNNEERDHRETPTKVALQDSLRDQLDDNRLVILLLVGLISQIHSVTLQDSLVILIKNLISRGQDIFNFTFDVKEVNNAAKVHSRARARTKNYQTV